MKLTDQQVTALEKSIRHWEENLQAANDDPNKIKCCGDSCACCQKFSPNNCKGCPVYLTTGESDCKKTPWGNVVKEFMLWEPDYPKSHKALIAAVQAELDFLKSILAKHEASE